ncbi:hypothetical protein ACQ4WX_35095 [Streptomyces lasalocidi]
MSLTSQIRDSSSSISRFFEEYLPDWRTAAAQLRRALDSANAPVRPSFPDGTRPPWGLIGRGIDERIRLMIGPTREAPSFPGGFHRDAQGQARVSLGYAAPFLRRALRNEAADIRAAIEAASKALTEALNAAQGPGKQDEELIARYCYLAAFFDVRGGIQKTIAWLLHDGVDSSLGRWVARVPQEAADDLVRLAELARSVFHPLADLPISKKFAGPHFPGSHDVGGADADLIVDRVLIDIKATIQPGKIGRAELYQLVGYALLDYDDVYELESIALYLARTGTLVRWDLDETIALMGSPYGIGDLRDSLSTSLERDRRARRARFASLLLENQRPHRPQTSVLAAWRKDLIIRMSAAMRGLAESSGHSMQQLH